MPALKPTEHTGTVIWLGHMLDRKEPVIDGVAKGRLAFGFDGVTGVPYGGRTRASCSRVTAQHPKGTEIANTRQVSIVSVEELDQIATRIGLQELDPAWLGATVVLEGIGDFSHIPPSSRLQGPDGVTFVVDMQNRPCHQPGLSIARHHTQAGKGFKTAAKGRRGVTAWIERPGNLELGNTVRLHIPDQRPWSPGLL